MFEIEAFVRSSSFVVLLLTTVVYWIQTSGLGVSQGRWLGHFGMCLSGALMFLYEALRWWSSGHVPLSNLYESLMCLCCSLIGCHLVLRLYEAPGWLGAITSSACMLVNGLSTLSLPVDMQASGLLVPALQSNWLLMHVSVMILGYGALLAGSLFSIALLFLWPHPHAPAASIPGPGADDPIAYPTQLELPTAVLQLDALSYKSIGVGFPLLTLGILSGAVWANEAWGSYWSWDPKETWALVTWLVFAVYLHARMVRGWQGRRPATVATLGFVVLWVCYLGVNWLGQGLHSYGWFS
uniref:cytochrome c biogenesis protein n=1 Tax=Hormidiella parvula TaxID=2058785 RepID=UPI00286CCC63|nr:cytochrome c biogenesis protein [Hormidiella parvula]WKT05979.1 cytochrome c biogenesis protein [Hormidiella parvula]